MIAEVTRAGCAEDPFRIGYDINRYVVAALRAGRDGWVPPYIDRVTYECIRKHPERFPDELVGFAGTACSFGAKWMAGYAKSTGTKPRDSVAEATRNFLAQAPKLRGCLLQHADYRTAIIPARSLIYCDPPYAGTTTYGASARCDGKWFRPGWSPAEFWDWCDARAAEGHTVFVSEYTAPAHWTCVWEKKTTATFDHYRAKGGERIERLFTRK